MTPLEASKSSTGPNIVFKALLLADVVDSTRLISRLGDVKSSQLFARVDEVARETLARWSGMEIDRTDGHFFLFDRPIDAVRCALDYHAALTSLVHDGGEELKVRIGIHFGEVIVKANSPEARAAGARPFELEGLALSVTSRVMSLALPGQTLLTRVAFDPARRSAVGDESMLSEVRWLAHGPYLFKGADEPQEVCEVGLEGKAPLAAPTDSEKARRAVAAGDEITLGWRPASGQRISSRPNWALTERLGEGSFGEAWLAVHEKTHEKRVFKFCFQADRLRGLKREVTLFRLLKETLGDRPDIARILDWQFDEFPYFLESSYTEGGSLFAWAEQMGGIANAPLSTRLEIIAQIAEALGAAHSVGVLHKDIKPSNVLIAPSREGQPQAILTDFGIGMITDSQLLAAQGITVTGFTEAVSSSSDSSGAGTRLYMAPELLEGKPATTLSDIYALGVMLYQMAAGNLHQALGVGWERDITDELLREDIASSTDHHADRRLTSAAELANRLRHLDRRREENEVQLSNRLAAEHANRRKKLLVISSFVGIILTIAAATIAIREKDRASVQARLKDEAQFAQTQAERARTQAETAKAKAEQEKMRAEQEKAKAIQYLHSANYEAYYANVRLAAASLAAGQPSTRELRRSLASALEDNRAWEHSFLTHWVGGPVRSYPEWPVTVPRGPWFTSDGRRILVPTTDNNVGLIDTISGAMVGEFSFVVQHSQRLWNCSLSTDGSRLLGIGRKGLVCLWDTNSHVELWSRDMGQELRATTKMETTPTLTSVEAWPRIGTFSSDCKKVILGHYNGYVSVVDAATGQFESCFSVSSKPISDLSISPDLQHFVTISPGQPPCIHELFNGLKVRELRTNNGPGSKSDAVSCDYSPDGHWVVTAHDSSSVLLWDVETGKRLRVLRGHASQVNSAHFSRDGRSIITGAEDGTAIIWDAISGQPLHTIYADYDNVSGGDISPMSDCALVSTCCGTNVWSLQDPTTCSILSVCSSRVRRVHFNADNRLAALSCGDGRIRIWDVQRMCELQALEGHTADVMDARFSPNGKMVASASDDATIRLWNFSDQSAKGRIMATHAGDVNGIAFSPDGKFIASASKDATARVWDIETGGEIANYHDPEIQATGSSANYGLRTVEFVPSSEELLISRWQPSGVVMWNYRTQEARRYPVTIGTMTGASISPDGQLIVCSTLWNVIRLLDRASGKTVRDITGLHGYVQDAQFSPDGKRIASAGQDGTVRILDTVEGRCMLTLDMPDNRKPWCIAFSPDGTMLAVGTEDGKLIIWRTVEPRTSEIISTATDGLTNVSDAIPSFHPPMDQSPPAIKPTEGPESGQTTESSKAGAIKPNPSEILRDAQADTRAGRYGEALAKFVWFHENALKYQKSLYGVRLSFALSYWRELALVYPPAMEKLKSTRDEAEQEVRKGPDKRDAFHDYVALNQKLGDMDKTRSLFEWLDINDPPFAKEIFGIAEPALILAKQYKLCGKYLDPDASYKREAELFQENKKLAADPKFGQEMAQFREKSFSNHVTTLVALLVQNDRKEEAESIANKAVKEWDNASFKAQMEKAKNGEVPTPWP